MPDYFAAEIQRFTPVVLRLVEQRARLFEQSNPEPWPGPGAPDPAVVFRLLETRKGGDYHRSSEKYGRAQDDLVSSTRNSHYRAAILEAAQALRFVAPSPGLASSEVDRVLGILDSDLRPIESEVAAVVVNGAGGASNLKRVRDAARNIAARRISTSRIILTGGSRVVTDEEQNRIPRGFGRGSTEAELLKRAAEDLLNASFDTHSQRFDVSYGEGLSAQRWLGTGEVDGMRIDLVAIEAPYDPVRTRREEQTKSPRVNTEEVFTAARPFVDEIDGDVVVQSHDTWTPWQLLIGKEVFELGRGRAVHPAGPWNENRVIAGADGGHDITSAEDVVDEIAKTFRQLFVTRDRFIEAGASREGENKAD